MLSRTDVLQIIEAVGGHGSLTYVSVPITSGRRAFHVMEAGGVHDLAEMRRRDPDAWHRDVQVPNERAAAEHARAVRHRLPADVVLNPAVLTTPAWGDDDYNGLWIDVIREFAKRVVATPDWAWSRGGRLEVAAAVSLGRNVETVDGRSLTIDALETAAEEARREVADSGWTPAEIDAFLPAWAPDLPNLPPSAAAKTFEWLTHERRYQVTKFGLARDDAHTKQGVGDGSWWRQQLFNYLHRAHVLGLDNPLGRQAVAKFTATACGLLESVIRVEGDLPAPGVPSGELNGRAEGG